MGKTFNKLLLLLMLILFSLVSANAFIIYEDNQTITQANYFSPETLWLGYLSPSDNKLELGQSVSQEITLAENLAYIIFGGRDNVSQTFDVTYYDMTTNQNITNSYTINPNEVILIELTPQNIGDVLKFTIDNISGTIGHNIVFTNLGEGGTIEGAVEDTTTIFTPLIAGVVELITINVALWKIGFYVVIFAFVIGTLLLLMWLVMKFYKWGKEHRLFKNRSNHR